MQRNITLYPWFKFAQQLLFWQATWFLYFESKLSAAEAILLFVIADIATTVLEVPSGYMSDRLGRRWTLVSAAICNLCACMLLVIGDSFAVFALANLLLGAGWAFASGTDTSLLFQSLKAAGREAEVEAVELTAWRFSFSALALSALSGGMLGQLDASLPYFATAAAAVGLLAITILFHEPTAAPQISHRDSIRAIGECLSQPVLRWLLALALASYAFSHLPFVFGQPFIREALVTAGYSDQAPLVSGAVTFLMMTLSLAVSAVALPLRRVLELSGLLLLAFGLQVGLAAVLAISNSPVVVGLLLLRMVPDALTAPFLLARIQPLLPDGVRATYLSLQSLSGRVVLSAMLSLSALYAPTETALAYPELQVILAGFTMLGILLWVLLAMTARRAGV